MCCTSVRPHVPVATICEISRYMYIRNALLIRLLKIPHCSSPNFQQLFHLTSYRVKLILRQLSLTGIFWSDEVRLLKFPPHTLLIRSTNILDCALSLSPVLKQLITRIEIVKLYYSLGESATAALRGYKTKHGLIKDPFIVSTITRLIAKFESTRSVLDFPGKGRKSLSDERAPIVQNAVEQLQSQSTRASSSITQVSQLTGIPLASVHCIMRRQLHLYSYHFKSKNWRGVCMSDA
ncbi:hypothetical protein CSKR_109277 [Clonorchis sinensis]|uniref:DUF4817 domain-containing protein n=1 Tax=Clonorchis sinensis TaxID=79923 RepID=A0A419Q1A4_CLOSI|nr:hypothetical protein CSKR_109277 [Clonorchis sinensis]